MGARERRFPGDVVTQRACLDIYADGVNANGDSPVRKFLEFCVEKDVNPEYLAPDMLVGLASKMPLSSRPAFISQVITFCQDAFGHEAFSDSKAVKRHLKSAHKAKKRTKVSFEMVDGAKVLGAIDAAVYELGGWSKLSPGWLRQYGAPVLLIGGGLRLCDLAKMPHMKFRTVPANVQCYAAADIIMVRIYAPKEALLRHGGSMWSQEIPCYQTPGNTAIPLSMRPPSARTSVGVVLDAMQRQNRQFANFDVDEVGQQVRLDGRSVGLKFLLLKMTRDGKRLQVERVPAKPLSSDSISNAVQKSFDLVNYPSSWKPRMLRHYFATAMQNGMVVRGRWTQQHLSDILRHKQVSTTTDAYIASSLHSDTQARWDAQADLEVLNPWALLWV